MKMYLESVLKTAILVYAVALMIGSTIHPVPDDLIVRCLVIPALALAMLLSPVVLYLIMRVIYKGLKHF